MSDAYLVLNGPRRGERHPANAGPVLRLTAPTWDLREPPSRVTLAPVGICPTRVITYTLQTLAVADGDTRKTHHFWLTEGTKGGAVTMVDLLIDLVGGEG